jgi:DNA-binding CsgD family transcriptional regulator
MTSMLHRRGDLVVELDTEGRVISDDAILAGDPRIPLRVLGRRLRTVDPLARQSVENAVARALPPERHISLVLLSDSDGRRYYLQIHPVPGHARDVFRSAAALAVLICGEPGLPTLRFDPSIIREAFDLTDREADVAGLLAEGLGLAAIARRLNIGAGTVRTYLKGAFEKTATRRQAELVALIARLAA